MRWFLGRKILILLGIGGDEFGLFQFEFGLFEFLFLLFEFAIGRHQFAHIPPAKCVSNVRAGRK